MRPCVVYQQGDAVTAAWADGATLQPALTFHAPPPPPPPPVAEARTHDAADEDGAPCWLLDGPVVVLRTGAGSLLTATAVDVADAGDAGGGRAWETRVQPIHGVAVHPRVLLAGVHSSLITKPHFRLMYTTRLVHAGMSEAVSLHA